MSKTGFRVSVVCDSINSGVRLTTVAVRMPRVILAECLTHRQLSRNASSSRAIPTRHMLGQVSRDPYMPDDLPDGPLRANSPGMVAGGEMSATAKCLGHEAYRKAMEAAVEAATVMDGYGWAKQDTNRVVEPYQWVRWLCTATDWDNFFALRTDHRAYPPFRFLARCMFVAMQRSVPTETRLHLPFIQASDWDAADDEVNPDTAAEPPDWFPGWWYGRDVSPKVAFNLMAWSAARCARVSVKNFRTDDTNRAKDMETFLKLTTDYPRHSSPCEHQAFVGAVTGGFFRGNFQSPWCQFRKLIPQETVEEFRPSPDEVAGWEIPDDVFGGTPGVDW